ncbi:NYN domain-containing protein [Schaalia sp. Marseille-Q2122]|uniref:NYN domain-containing protein n=1 Tax=Schaalia sp. Marseille-Q2122 TaxID=2736604 RepID=UPI00158CD481|nr:NYN domain-containing protein [Schaalia sp. Marseille-Q2122]
MVLRMAVVMDYQNVHLSAAGIFLPGRPQHEALIDPYAFAQQVAAARNASNRPEFHVAVSDVYVFRGQPSSQHDPSGYSRSQAQKSSWEYGHGGHVQVTMRPLKYRSIRSIDGAVQVSAQEKGIDVLCALYLVRLARSGQYDVVVLASRDTDLAPALDEAAQLSGCKVEAVKWYDPSNRSTWGRIRTASSIWTTNMEREHFLASLDTRDYS